MMKLISKLSITILVIILSCSILIGRAQTVDCSDVVKQVLKLTGDKCSQISRDQACYGNLLIDATARPEVTNFQFTNPGDSVDVADVQSLRLSQLDTATNRWGVAYLHIQANLPDTSAGQYVTMLLFGSTELQDTSRTVSTTQTPYKAMQAIYFRSGLGAPACHQTPTNGMIIQNASGNPTANLLIDGVQVTIASTVLFEMPIDLVSPEASKTATSTPPPTNTPRALQATTVAPHKLIITTIEGRVTVTAKGQTRIATTGNRVTVPLDDMLQPAGPPALPIVVDTTAFHDLQVQTGVDRKLLIPTNVASPTLTRTITSTAQAAAFLPSPYVPSPYFYYPTNTATRQPTTPPQPTNPPPPPATSVPPTNPPPTSILPTSTSLFTLTPSLTNTLVNTPPPGSTLTFTPLPPTNTATYTLPPPINTSTFTPTLLPPTTTSAPTPTSTPDTCNPVRNTTDNLTGGSLRCAIANAPSGATITFLPYVTGTISLTKGDLLITKNVTITGPGASTLTIDGTSNTNRIFEIQAAATITGLTISHGNTSGITNGGGIYVNGGTLTLINSVISNNGTSGSTVNGGGIYINSPGLNTFSSTTFSGNTAVSGGGVYVAAGNVTIIGGAINGNTSLGSASVNDGGGGLYMISPGTLTVTSGTFSGNKAKTGGGLYATAGTVNISGSVFGGNVTTSSTLNEGGAGLKLYDASSNAFPNVTVQSSTFLGNSSANYGGAVYALTGTLQMTNDTLSGNYAANGGGGIFNTFNAATTLKYVTVASNTAGGLSAGVENYTGGGPATLAFSNTILADNKIGNTPSDCGDTLTSHEYNLILAPTCTINGGTAHNITAADPELAPLDGNTPPTRPLQAGSPAIDAIPLANCGGVSTDERNKPRPQGSGCDIGAYEYP